jgi:hypothetical protein
MPESTPAESAIDTITIAFEAVPHVGSTLYGVASSFLAEKETKGLVVFLLALAKDLQDASERINTEFVHRQEFKDFAEFFFSKASEIERPEKLDALREVFLNTVLSDDPKVGEAEEIAKTI